MTSPFRTVRVLCALLLLGAAPAPGATVVGTQVHTYAAGSREPMLYPTSVAVDSMGRVWVADGARDRVLVFAADGTLSQTIRRVAGVALSRPMGIATTPDGRVWIADAGNARIAVTGATSAHESALPVPPKLGRVDLTDVEVAADGKRLWAVDNDGHRVLTLDVPANRWEARGSKGSGWGSFNHPRSVAVDDAGRTYVADVLNGRVQRFDAEGRAARPMVPFGVSPGQVFRPSGIDAEDGRVWVADSVLGVVQVFGEDGALIDAVRDPTGNVHHFDAPIGIEVVGDRLFVVESGGGKVTEHTVAAGGGQPLQATSAKATSTSASEGQECNLCHLDLTPPLDARVATALTPVPPKKGGVLWAGTEAACVSCHDGAVLDSRKHIWSGFAHPTGDDAKIPATMKIPKDIPLVDGKIACRTCHSPHTLAGSGQKHRGAVMLRVNARPSELCVACHGTEGGRP